MCTPMRGRLSTKFFTSPPAQNAFPVPVMITHRTPGSSSASRATWKSSRPSVRESALKASGRFSVIVMTPAARSTVSVSYPIVSSVRERSARADARGLGDCVQQVLDLHRLHEHRFHALAPPLLRAQLHPEAGDQEDGHVGRDGLHGADHL